MRDEFVDMSNREYHARHALGSSDVRRLMISPLHFEGREEPAVRPTYFTFGSAAHTGYLEPDKFEDKYRPKPIEVDGKGPRTNHYKEWLASQPEVEWMSADDYDKVLKVIEAALAHPVSTEMFKGEIVTEGSVFFGLNGVECKARPDLVVPKSKGRVDVLDLKTTTDASPDAFRKTVGKNGYHIQEWFYRKALNSLGLDVDRFVFLAVEKSAPYATASYTLNQEDVHSMGKRVIEALDQYKTAKETDVWEGYSKQTMELSVPPWALPDGGFAPNGNWLTPKQAMKHVGVTRTTLYNWMSRGLESKKLGGKRMISARALASYPK